MRARLILPVLLVAGALILAAIPAVALAADPPQPAFGGPLAGSQEVPAVTTTATGEGTAVISPDGSKIWYVVTYSGLSGPAVAAHIHTGASGQAGGIILPLKVSDSPMVGTLTSADFKASGPITTFAQAVAAIKGGQTYFNIHTAANGGGEIRGQIVAKGDAQFAHLTGSQEVPAVKTSATGDGWALISSDGSTITYYVSYSGLSGAAVAAHIHTGATGQAGGIILPLKVTDSPMVGTLTSADFKASGPITSFADAVAAIKGGQTYFNIHTAANGGGEIRGQIGVTVPGSLPATSTQATEPPSGGSVLPALIGLLVFVALMVIGGRRLAPRAVRQ
jgi:hypothetical protein